MAACCWMMMMMMMERLEALADRPESEPEKRQWESPAELAGQQVGVAPFLAARGQQQKALARIRPASVPSIRPNPRAGHLLARIRPFKDRIWTAN